VVELRNEPDSAETAVLADQLCSLTEARLIKTYDKPGHFLAEVPNANLRTMRRDPRVWSAIDSELTVDWVVKLVGDHSLDETETIGQALCEQYSVTYKNIVTNNNFVAMMSYRDAYEMLDDTRVERMGPANVD
jgi:hypothetical protein